MNPDRYLDFGRFDEEAEQVDSRSHSGHTMRQQGLVSVEGASNCGDIDLGIDEAEMMSELEGVLDGTKLDIVAAVS